MKEKGTFFDPKIKSDVQGSYTGKPVKPDEKPVQDADDL